MTNPTIIELTHYQVNEIQALVASGHDIIKLGIHIETRNVLIEYGKDLSQVCGYTDLKIITPGIPGIKPNAINPVPPILPNKPIDSAEQQPHKITFWPNGQLSARDLAGNTVDSLQAKGWMELYFEYLEQQGIDPATIQFEAMYGDHWMIIEPFKTNYGWNVNLKKQER